MRKSAEAIERKRDKEKEIGHNVQSASLKRKRLFRNPIRRNLKHLPINGLAGSSPI